MKYRYNSITLYREVNDKVRYYSFKIYATLFNTYMLEKSYGSIKNKRATGILREFYDTYEDALKALNTQKLIRIKRGYTFNTYNLKEYA